MATEPHGQAGRLERLYARRTFGIKPGLDEIRALLRELGDPQENFRVLHVAGTDGKGSVSTMLASILRAAGLRAGLYTSPHLVRLSERFRIDGAEIPDDAFFPLLDEVEAAAARLVARGLPEPTFFETTTALCALWFAHEGVKLAVAEVGMGGRLDATNAFLPAVAVVTRIGMDHMQYLGDTIEVIAREKAGIAKMKAADSDSGNTGIKPTERTAGNSFRLQDGKLYMQTSKTIKASVVQFDYQGRILWQSAVQHFTPGKHAIDVPEASTQSIYRLSIK